MDLRQVRFTPRRMDWTGDPNLIVGAKYQHRLTKAVDFGQGRIEPVWSIPKVTNGSTPLVLDVPVTPVDVDWAVQVYAEIPDGQGGTYTETETVKVPAGSYSTILDFEDLDRVDPRTLGPVTAPTSVWETRLAAVELAIATGGGSGGGAPAGTGTAGRYRVTDLEDITTVGEALGLAASQTAGRSAIAAAAASHTHGVSDLTATGTKDTTTFLRGDNTFAVPPAAAAASTTAAGVVELATTGETTTGTDTARAVTPAGLAAALAVITASLTTALADVPVYHFATGGTYPGRPITERPVVWATPAAVPPAAAGTTTSGTGPVLGKDLGLYAIGVVPG